MYEAPESDAVPGLVQELVHELESDVTTPAIVRAAMAHLNLVLIHPFRDGNGRMSRCIQTLVLAREQILAQELCSIEEYLGRNTDAYYRILAQVGQVHGTRRTMHVPGCDTASRPITSRQRASYAASGSRGGCGRKLRISVKNTACQSA